MVVVVGYDGGEAWGGFDGDGEASDDMEVGNNCINGVCGW